MALGHSSFSDDWTIYRSGFELTQFVKTAASHTIYEPKDC